MKKFLSNAVLGILVAWFVLSYAEIAIKNTNPNPQYSSWNCWILFTGKGK